MKTKNEKIISCEIKKIHKPKPKKLYKINDCFKGNSKFNPGQRKIPNYNNDFYNKRSIEHNKNKLNKFDFESISLEEIENDFMAIKAKSEALKVENELLKILFEPSNIEKHNNFKNKMKKKLSPEENKCNINIQNKK